MPRKIAKLKPPKTVFDWSALEKLITENGGIQAVTERAGTSRQAFYYARTYEGMPLSEPIRKILAHLNPPPTVIKSLFTKPPKESL